MNLNNWMKNIGDEKSLEDINIPATHDSSTKYCTLSLFASCQKFSISEQLGIGVRAFDIRVNGMNLVHAFCKCKKSFLGSQLILNDVVGDMLTFLKENPTETILMFFKMDAGEDSAKCLELLFRNFIDEDESNWFLENRIPSLGEVRGKICLLRRTDSLREKAGIDFTMMPYHGSNKETKADTFSPNGVQSVTVQDRYNLSRYKKWEKAVKPLLESGKEGFVLNYLSTAGFPVIPRFNARHVNRQFMSFNLKAGKKYGTLMFDFITPEISKKVIDTNR